jgi:hypothetical protein
MGIDVRWVSRGRRDVVSYHKWMTSHNFFDFGVNVGLQLPNKKEKLTTYYSIKKRYGQILAVIISPATLLARGYNSKRLK